MKIKPRQKKELSKKIRPKSAWVFKKSVFRDFRPDTIKLLNDCFETDWKCILSKIEYLMKETREREKVKEIVRANYKYIYFGYKYCAGKNCLNNFMSIND